MEQPSTSVLVSAISWFIYLLPYLMGCVFVAAVTLRYLVYFSVKRHELFAREFEKRANFYIEHQNPDP